MNIIVNFFIILISLFLVLIALDFNNKEDFAFFVIGIGFSVVGIAIGLLGLILDKNFFEC